MGLGATSVHWNLAVIACETGISPLELMRIGTEYPRMLWTMERYLIAKHNPRS